jgi:cobalt/nickel transport system permease protein
MHIGTGILSPPVWGAAAAVSGVALAGSLAVAGRRLDDRKIPLMGVMGAFVFAAQMVNFPILGGTSGHLGGGLLLGILLGAPLGVIVMASILTVQAMLFQDGGVEALGANIFVMGVLPCLLGALVRPLWRRPNAGRIAEVATFVAGAAALVAGRRSSSS